jgi:hypothetical protein
MAPDKRELKAIGTEIAASADLLTTREAETLREVYEIVLGEIKKSADNLIETTASL